MKEFSQEQANALAEALRRMASKIERGYPLTEQQEKTILKLSREILFTRQSKKIGYQFKSIKPVRLLDEDEEQK